MIHEALKYLIQQGAEAAAPMQVETGDPAKLTYLVQGKLVEIPKAVRPRTHTAEDIETLVATANRWEAAGPVIWVCEIGAVLVIDDADGHRVNTVTMHLKESEVFAKLRELDRAKPWLDQRAFIRLLRIDLAGTMPPGILLDRVRKIRFESGQVTHQEAARNRESMGRQVTAAISADGEIPEAVALEVTVFRGLMPAVITCSVDVDPGRGLLQLAPLPDELERVTELVLDDLKDRLTEDTGDGVTVYRGKP